MNLYVYGEKGDTEWAENRAISGLLKALNVMCCGSIKAQNNGQKQGTLDV